MWSPIIHCGSCNGIQANLMKFAILNGVVCTNWSKEVARDEKSALVDELVEGVLSICTWLTPDNGACVVGDSGAVACHVLSV